MKGVAVAQLAAAVVDSKMVGRLLLAVQEPVLLQV